MASIDQRVVQMKFDNAEFQKGVQSTTKSINDLNSSLNGAQGGKNYLSGLSSNVQNASSSFSGLQVAAITALGTIVSKATTAGLSLVKSLSLDPIMGGFRDYETKMNSVKVISANSGESMQVINTALADMNQYATKTIYSFADMTKNMGLFTNAGLGVTESASMLKGFSNEAARSGTNATQAAGAAYQLSQALSAGTIRLMDWRSLTNANMGSSKMREGLVQIAEAMGTIESAGTTSEAVLKDFNGSLEKGWLSSDVMSNYLQIMAGDMDATKMAALGLSEAQIKAFQDSAKEAQGAAQNMSTFSQMWETVVESVKTGWMALSEDLFGGLDEATKLWTGIGNAITGVIDGIFGSMHKVLVQWDELGGKAELFNSIAGFLKGIGKILGTVGSAFAKAFSGSGGKGLKAVTSAISKLFQILAPSEKTIQRFANIFSNLVELFKIVVTPVKAVASAFSGFGGSLSILSGSVVDGALSAIESLTGLLVDFGNSLISSASNSTIFNSFVDTISNSLSSLGNILTAVKDSVGSVFSGLTSAVKAGAESVSSIMSSSLGSLSKGTEITVPSIDLSNLLITGGLTAGIYKVSSSISDGITSITSIGEELKGSITGIKDTFTSLSDTLQAFTASIKAETLKKIATAVALLTVSLLALSFVDSDKIATGLGAIAGELIILSGFLFAISKGSKIFGSLNLAGTAASILVLSIAIGVLSGSLLLLSNLDLAEVGTSLLALAGALTIVGIALKMIPSNIPGAASILILSAAIGALSVSLLLLSNLSLTEVGTSLLALAGALVIIGSASKLLPGPGAAIGLSLMSAAIVVLAAGLMMLSTLSLSEIGTSILGLASALLVLIAAGSLIDSMSKTAPITLIALGAALVVLSSGLLLLSAVPLTSLLTGLLGLALALGVLAALSVLLSPLTPTMLGLAAALLVFGLGMTAISLAVTLAASGLLLFVLAIQTLVTVVSTSGTAIITAVTTLVQAIIAGFATLISGLIAMAPQIGELALTMLTTFLTVLVEATPQIVQAGCDMIIALLDGLARNIGEIVTKATDLIVNFINGITQNLPRIIDAGFNLVVSLVTGIAKKIGEMATKGGEIVGKLVSGIGSKIHQLWDKGKEMAQNVIDGLKNALSSGIEQVKNKILDIAKGAWDAFKGFFGIHSPSKLMMSGGQYIIAGLVKGLRKDGHLASEAIADEGKNMASSMKDTVKTLSDIMALDMDTTITPTMDLTNIEKASGDISKLLDGYSVQLGANTLASEKLKTGYSLKAAEAAKPNNISFTQNNYSPKALSTVEIYRQTNSQINRVKSMIGI